MGLESFFVATIIDRETLSAFVNQSKKTIDFDKNQSQGIYKNNIRLTYYDSELCLEGCLLNLIDSCSDMYNLLNAICESTTNTVVSIGRRKDVEMEDVTLSKFVSAVLEIYLEKYQAFQSTFGKFSLPPNSFYKFKRKNKKCFRREC